jgi:hypothetical protein
MQAALIVGTAGRDGTGLAAPHPQTTR